MQTKTKLYDELKIPMVWNFNIRVWDCYVMLWYGVCCIRYAWTKCDDI